MHESTNGEILLLKDSCKLVREIADFFAGDDDRAQRARKRLEKRQKDSSKGKTSAAFYANIAVDLETLDETLQGLAYTWTNDQGFAISAVCQVLEVLEDEFLVKEELIKENDSEDGSEQDGSAGDGGVFVFVRAFVAEFEKEFGDEPGDDTDRSAKVDWFCQVTKFGSPKGKSRDLLLQAVKGCDSVLKPFSSLKAADISYQQNRAVDIEWAEAGEAFRIIERLHSTLDDWDCNCFERMSHRDAKFAFDFGPSGSDKLVTGTMFYPWLDGSERSAWRHVHLEFHGDGNSPTLSSHRDRFITGNQGSAVSGLGDLCNILEEIACHGEGAVKLAAGHPMLCDIPSHAIAFQDLLATGDGSLVDCYNLPQPQRLFKMSSKHRMSMALILAYAYLHLGGGSWWPYDKKPSLHSPVVASEDIHPSRLLFFSPNFSSASNEELPFVLRAFNSEMPSLPAFGKLLLELFLGQSVDWDELNKRLDRARDEPLATEILQAISICLATGTDKTFKSGGTIREDERLRDHFVKGVLMPIQYVLRVGYHLKPQDVFKTPSASGVVEIKELPPRRLKPHSPIRFDGPETVSDGFCLHDGQEGLEELSKTHSKSADKYILDLQKCSHTFFRRKRQSLHRIDPVRIAILDTGVHIPSEQVENVYENRIKECRTWLSSTRDDGDPLAGPRSDRDGHGTHGTSILLEATQNTGIEVFVAQIFDKRTEKVKNDSIIDHQTVLRISNAIRYAVDRWNVDVISMSFGFPLVVPEIEKAIEHARRNDVLMLAAASNCGGTRSCTWPARSDNIICVYATDGDGNKYSKNPTPQKNKNNFAVLGDSVEALWPPLTPQGVARKVRKSGTSTATPICAAVAGIVMTAMRQNEDSYVSSFDDSKQERERRKYRRKVDALGKASGMASVFKLMVGDDGMRDDYQFLAPWRVLEDSNRSRTTTLENILGCIDA